MTPSPDPVDKPAPLHREESTTPDLVELTRRTLEAINRGDLDTALSVFGPDSVWDDSAIGLGTHDGDSDPVDDAHTGEIVSGKTGVIPQPRP